MTSMKKKRLLNVFKYTWPLYIFSAAIIFIAINLIFGVTHRMPAYKSITMFATGEVKDYDSLENHMLETYKEKELKAFSCYYNNEEDQTFETMLSVIGMNSADILIMTASKMNDIDIKSFVLPLDDNLINSYYSGYTFYEKEDVKYGVKLDKSKVEDYFNLPTADCFLVFNIGSSSLGEYSKKPNAEHDTALQIVKDWGM